MRAGQIWARVRKKLKEKIPCPFKFISSIWHGKYPNENRRQELKIGGEEHKSVTWLEMIAMTILVIRTRCLSPRYWLQELLIPEKWHKWQFTEIYVLIRDILIFLALCFHAILYETPFWLQLAITFCICWLIIGSLFHPLAVVIVDKYRKEEAGKVYSFNRSFILLFVNYVEIIIGFAYLYLHLELVRPSDCSTPINTVGEALYFSVVTVTTLGYGDMRPLPGLGRFCASVEPLMGFVLLILVVGLFFVELGKRNEQK